MFVRAEASQKMSAKKSTVMAKTAHFVVCTMATIVTCQYLREFLWLARKYKKRFLGGFENGLGDVSKV